VQPSSLVFVAIVVGWAAYLLPQWLRRRDTLSQARGGDRHSAGLRVLDRRTRVAAGPSSVPLLPDPGTVAENVTGSRGIADRKTDGSTRRPGDGSLAARRRARVLTVLLAVTGAAWVMSVVLPALTAVAVGVTVLLGLDVLALVVVARRRAVRRAMAERARRSELRRRQARSAAARQRGDAARDAVPAASTQPSVPEESVEPVDGEREEAPAERVARELAEGGTPWVPVPVPPPTYTLKPAAPRPEPAPLDLPPAPLPTDPAEPAADAPAEPAARTPRPWDDDRTFADDLDLDAVLARRRAVNG
jgi:hypothetical protein